MALAIALAASGCPSDGSNPDGAPLDGSPPIDGSTADGATLDAATPDAESPDAATPDAGSPDAGGSTLGCDPLPRDATPLPLRIVARSGDIAGTGTSLVLEWYSGVPHINADGDVMFYSRLSGAGVDATNDQALWRDTGAGLELVAREGSAAPGLPGSTRAAPTPIGMDAAGGALYASAIDGTGTAVWLGDTVVARSGGMAPGGAEYWFPETAMYRGGAPVILLAGLDSVPDPSSPSGLVGLFTGAPGAMSLVTRTGDSLSGVPGSASRQFYGIRRSRSGHLALNAELEADVGGVTYDDDNGLWSWVSGTAALVAREGDPAPGVADATFTGIWQRGFEINDAGDVLFSGAVAGSGITGLSDVGLWIRRGGVTEKIWHEGEPAACAAGTWGEPMYDEEAALNDAGMVAFATLMRSPNAAGVWLWQDGAFGAVIRSGEQAPGGGMAVTGMAAPMLNNRGQVAFGLGLIQGLDGVDATNDSGLYATDTAGNLRVVMRRGAMIDLAGDGSDVRTVNAIEVNIANGSGTSGPGAEPTGTQGDVAFNDDGELAMLVGFTDGSWAVVVATVD